MAKDKLTDYDSTASNNTDVGGISVAEGMLPSGVNNAIREQMSHLADFAAGTSGVDVLKLQDDTDTNSIKLQAPSSVTADTTFTMPDGDGSADQVLKTDGSGQLGWVAQTAVAPNPNLIINPAMTVNQRGDVTGKTATTYGGPDRWELGISGLGTYSISQSSTAPDGFSNSYKVDCTTADASPASSDFLVATQKIEAQNLQHLQYGSSSAQQLTLSFYVRSNKTGTYVCELLQPDASDRHISKTYTISSANTWEYKTITFAGDSSGVINNDNGIGLFVNWWLGSGSGFSSGTLQTSWGALDQTARAVGNVNIADSTANDWYITGVKLEVGSSSTSFIHESYGDTLEKCQRYFQTMAAGADWTGQTWSGGGNGLPVAMRASPTLSNVSYILSANIDTTVGVNGLQLLLTDARHIGWQMLQTGTGRAYGWCSGDLNAEL
jgi:hypothetical protein